MGVARRARIAAARERGIALVRGDKDTPPPPKAREVTLLLPGEIYAGAEALWNERPLPEMKDLSVNEILVALINKKLVELQREREAKAQKESLIQLPTGPLPPRIRG